MYMSSMVTTEYYSCNVMLFILTSISWNDIENIYFFNNFCTEVQGDIRVGPMQGISPLLYPLTKGSHDTGNFTPYSFRIVCGFFTVPHELINMEGICETGPMVYSPYLRRLESLTICWCNYKGSTFYSVIRPWVLVRLESNSQPPAWQHDAQPTEPRVPQIETNKDGLRKDNKNLLATIYEYSKAFNAQKGWAGFDFTWSFFGL